MKNLDGVFFGMKHALAQFLRQGGGGAIVNMASTAGTVAYPGIAWADDPAALGQRLENMTCNVVHHSADAKESGKAFLDKRKPNCVGR